jgi:TonB-dependent SusC/RagA subfamily outer membrane receptor
MADTADVEARAAAPVGGQVVGQVAVPVGMREGPRRELKLSVRNARGRVVTGLPLVVQLRGERARTLDRGGDALLSVTDADTLLVALGNSVWEFPVAGFDSLRVVVRNRRSIAGLAVSDGSGELLEVGYGRVPRRDAISSVSQLDMRGASSYSDLRSYMMGRVAGVSFIGNTMVIRGISTIYGNTEPLFVVDGVTVGGSFESLNASISPHDVESITVLKDGGSTAIYGVRGACGVVLIRTKRGLEKGRARLPE